MNNSLTPVPIGSLPLGSRVRVMVDTRYGSATTTDFRHSAGLQEDQAVIVGRSEALKIVVLALDESRNWCRHRSLLDAIRDTGYGLNRFQLLPDAEKMGKRFWTTFDKRMVLSSLFIPNQKCLHCDIPLPHSEVNVCSPCRVLSSL